MPIKYTHLVLTLACLPCPHWLLAILSPHRRHNFTLHRLTSPPATLLPILRQILQ